MYLSGITRLHPPINSCGISAQARSHSSLCSLFPSTAQPNVPQLDTAGTQSASAAAPATNTSHILNGLVPTKSPGTGIVQANLSTTAPTKSTPTPVRGPVSSAAVTAVMHQNVSATASESVPLTNSTPHPHSPNSQVPARTPGPGTTLATLSTTATTKCTQTEESCPGPSNGFIVDSWTIAAVALLFIGVLVSVAAANCYKSRKRVTGNTLDLPLHAVHDDDNQAYQTTKPSKLSYKKIKVGGHAPISAPNPKFMEILGEK